MKVKDIKRMQISKLLEGVADRTPIEANRCHSQLSVMFKRALNLGWIEHSPMYGMGKPSIETKGTRVLNRDEIKLIWRQLSTLSDNSRDAFKLLFLTAQRMGEVLSMKWDDVDFNEAEWLMAENKSDRPHIVPLSQVVINILSSRPKNSMFVFPSRYKSKGHIRSLKADVIKLRKLTGILDWSCHDIRRTARTLLSELNVPMQVAELVLNHSIKGLVGVYDKHLFLNEKREALKKLANLLEFD